MDIRFGATTYLKGPYSEVKKRMSQLRDTTPNYLMRTSVIRPVGEAGQHFPKDFFQDSRNTNAPAEALIVDRHDFKEYIQDAVGVTIDDEVLSYTRDDIKKPGKKQDLYYENDDAIRHGTYPSEDEEPGFLSQALFAYLEKCQKRGNRDALGQPIQEETFKA